MNDPKTSTNSPRLGDYLGLADSALRDALARQQVHPPDQPPRRLGDIVLEMGLASQEIVQRALLRQRADRLRNCAIFSRLPESELKEVCGIVGEVTIPSGAKFIEQNTTGDCFYVIASGRVAVFGEYTEEGGAMSESVLATLEGGQTIGEMGYFSDGRRSASARAIERSELLRVPYCDLAEILESVPTLATGFLSVVTARLRQTNFQYHSHVHHRRAAERSLKHLAEYLDFSGQVDLRLDIEQGIEALIQRLVQTVSKLLNAERASLFLLDANTGDLWSKVAEGESSREIRVPRGLGIAGWVAEHGQIQNVPDAYQDSRFDRDVDQRTGYRTRSILCGPVRNIQGQIIGVIQVINRKTDSAFGPDDEAIFKAFAHQAAIAVENFNLVQRLKYSHEKMALMLDVATSVTQTLDLPLLLHRLVAKISEILECDRATVFVHDKASSELWSLEASGEGLKEIRFPAESGLAGFVARTGRTVNIPDAYADPRFNPDIDHKTNYHTHSVLCVPVLNRENEVVGVVQAINKRAGAFVEEDARFLRAISSQIAVSLANAQLYARAESTRNYLESVQQSISNGILTLDEAYKVVTANRAALDVLDADPNACVQCDLRKTLGAPNQPLFSLLERAYAGGNAIGYEIDLELPNSPRKASVVNASALPLLPMDETPSIGKEKKRGIVVVLDDITRERRAVGSLTRYVAKEVAEQILSDPNRLQLGGKRCKATILFCDIRSFTTLSEGMEAEEVVEMLNSFFTAMVDNVLENGGMLDKFMGDAMMALFGIPFPGVDDARRAVRCALRMRATLKDFNVARTSRGLRPIEMGIGMSTGEVVCGNIGSQKHMNYTVIGNPVIVASRLEGLNKYYGTQILISPGTRHDLGELFALRLVDHVLPMGKTHPMPMYEVLGESNMPTSPWQEFFDTGLEAYRQRRFASARELFRRGAEEDPVCRVFAERCDHFLAEPPPADWNGVWHATGK